MLTQATEKAADSRPGQLLWSGDKVQWNTKHPEPHLDSVNSVNMASSPCSMEFLWLHISR